jgi:hypothetical protein
MTHQNQRLLSFSSALALSLILVLAGCGVDHGSNSGQPSGTPDSQFFRTDSNGAAGPVAQGVKPIKGTRVAVPEDQTVLIDGSVGGAVALHEYSLSVPAGAFEGTLEVKVEDPDNGFVECKLYPEGLAFDVPVTLTMDLSSIAIADGESATIYWWDPSAGVWVDMHGTWDPATRTVSAQLPHFSDYRGGRAGW